jgi:hypothetical protein
MTATKRRAEKKNQENHRKREPTLCRGREKKSEKERPQEKPQCRG